MSRTIQSRPAAEIAVRGSIARYAARWFSALVHARAARRMLSPFTALALLVAIACSDDTPAGPQPIPVASVTVSPATQTMTVASSATLTASLADASGRPITGRVVAWSSNRTDIATVTSTGIVTAVSVGTATIQAASEGKSGSAVITVARVPVARIEISPTALALVEGETATLTALAKDANGAVLEDRAVTWRSSDATIASIDASGRVTAVHTGAATMTAESEGKSATVEVEVGLVPVATVTVSALPTLLETGDQETLTATLEDAAGRVLEGRTVTWATNDAAIATVSPTGAVVARGVGSVTITATSEGKSASTTATVEAPPSADLIYQRTDPRGNEIFVLGVSSGAAPVRVNAGNVSHQPTVSSDGSRLAFFVSMVAQNGEVVEDIFTVDRIGTNMKRLTATPGVDNAPAWSPVPGSNRIAYHRLDPATGRSDIWVTNADGTNAQNLTVELPFDLWRDDPAWSPDGQWIAFTQSRGTAGPGRGSIWIMRADGSEKRQLTSHPDNGFDLGPSWSPDGQRIAFQRGGIAIVTVATGAVSYLDLPGTASQPAWSPDGRHIAFAWRPSEPGSGTWELYTVRPDGSGMRLRTTNPAWGGGVSPAWTPAQR
jgi:Tol biopolymer transport system component